MTLVSKQEAIRRGPLSRRQIEALHKAGMLPGLQVGKRYLVAYDLLLDDIENLVKASCKRGGKKQ